MRRLVERLRKSTSTLLARAGGANNVRFIAGLLAITASAATVSLFLGLLVGGLLLVATSLIDAKAGSDK